MSNPFGQPGNRSRTGMAKPVGSGKANRIGHPITSVTIRVSVTNKRLWFEMAYDRQQTVGELIREMMGYVAENYVHAKTVRASSDSQDIPKSH